MSDRAKLGSTTATYRAVPQIPFALGSLIISAVPRVTWWARLLARLFHWVRVPYRYAGEWEWTRPVYNWGFRQFDRRHTDRNTKRFREAVVQSIMVNGMEMLAVHTSAQFFSPVAFGLNELVSPTCPAGKPITLTLSSPGPCDVVIVAMSKLQMEPDGRQSRYSVTLSAFDAKENRP